MSGLSIALPFFLAAGIGALIGVERERGAQRGHAHSAGIRTFILVSLFGALCAHLSSVVSPLSLVVGAVVIGALVVTVAVADFKAGDVGITTEVALLITYALGVLTQQGQEMLAIALGVMVTLILSLKVQMHSFAGRLSEEELFAIIKFVVASALLLPLLPSVPLDDAGVFVPRQIGLTVVLVLALNFVSYFAAKFWDPRKGLMTTAILGGLVSSTAATWNFSGKSREDPSRALEYALGTLLAIVVMLPRVGLLAYVTNPQFGAELLPALLGMAVAGVVPLVLLKRRCSGSHTVPPENGLGNPFELQEGLRFGVLFLVVAYIVHHARQSLGEGGLLVASGLAGVADLDAISITIAQVTARSVPIAEGLSALILAVNVNNLVKLLIALGRGSGLYRLWLTVGVLSLLAAGAVIQFLWVS